jgi:hypothetical protein
MRIVFLFLTLQRMDASLVEKRLLVPSPWEHIYPLSEPNRD